MTIHIYCLIELNSGPCWEWFKLKTLIPHKPTMIGSPLYHFKARIIPK